MIAKEDRLILDVKSLKYKSPKSYVKGTVIKQMLPVYYGDDIVLKKIIRMSYV
jgi:hypothetical protein